MSSTVSDGRRRQAADYSQQQQQQQQQSQLTIVQHAAKTGDLQTLRKASLRLCQRRKKDLIGLTAVHQAAAHGQLRCLRLLAERGVDINRCDNEGNTALHHAVINGQSTCVIFLTNFGANLWCMNDNYQTARDLAAILNKDELTRYLDTFASRQDSKTVAKLHQQAVANADVRRRRKHKYGVGDLTSLLITSSPSATSLESSATSSLSANQLHHQYPEPSFKTRTMPLTSSLLRGSTTNGALASSSSSLPTFTVLTMTSQLNGRSPVGHVMTKSAAEADSVGTGTGGTRTMVKGNVTDSSAGNRGSTARQSRNPIPAGRPSTIANAKYEKSRYRRNENHTKANGKLEPKEECYHVTDEGQSDAIYSLPYDCINRSMYACNRRRRRLANGLENYLLDRGLHDYWPLFCKESIDLESIKLLTEEDFCRLGLPMGPRRKILADISLNKLDVSQCCCCRPVTALSESNAPDDDVLNTRL